MKNYKIPLDELKMLDPESYDNIMYLKEHNVPYTDIQFNLMFLDRQYGKTFMSFGKTIIDAKKELKKSNRYLVTPGKYDPDVKNHEMERYWFKGFEQFINDYFKDEFILEKNYLLKRVANG